MYALNRAVTVVAWPGFHPKGVTFVAGTEVVPVDPEAGRWAVADLDLVARLTGDAKRAASYYVYVPANAVTEN
jgi:hypothetical protein